MPTRGSLVPLAAALVGLALPAFAQTRTGISIQITNARASKATRVEVLLGEQVIARHTKPIAPGARATIRLPRPQDCLVAISASFEDGSGEISADGQDACNDRKVRLVD